MGVKSPVVSSPLNCIFVVPRLSGLWCFFNFHQLHDLLVDLLMLAAWTWLAPITRLYSTGAFLTSSKTVLYPHHYNSHNKRYRSVPARADMKVVPAKSEWISSNNQ